jgi:acetoin utilization deacetylase AcuC-like enzyme
MEATRLAVVQDPRFEKHESSRLHPERPERLAAVKEAIRPLHDALGEIGPRPATDDEILRVHDREHLALLRSLEGARADLDPDTYVSPRSVEIARLAAGSTIELARRVARREARSGFALIRPPGHHAERDRAMGFCLLNNLAIAVKALVEQEKVDRIAIVDWDVHHGNGTQHTFESERDVLFVSLHQFPFYPGTGALGEMGTGPGEGTTVNLPLAAGAGDGEYGAAFDRIVVPVIEEFGPELILVSAGFDAHARDPLANMLVSSEGFAAMALRLRGVAESVCDGRLVLTLEGGYDLEALGASVAGVAGVLLADDPTAIDFPSPHADFLTSLDRMCEAHAIHWSAIR